MDLRIDRGLSVLARVRKREKEIQMSVTRWIFIADWIALSVHEGVNYYIFIYVSQRTAFI